VHVNEVHAAIRFDNNTYLLATRNGPVLLRYDKGYKVLSLNKGNGIVFSAFGKISEGQFIAGSWSQGVHIMDFTKGELKITEIEDFPYNGIQNLYTSENNEYIASSNLGMIFLRKKQFLPAFETLNNGIIDCIHKDDEGNLYFSKDNIIYKKSLGKDITGPIIDNSDFAPNMVMYHAQDSLLIGTIGGQLLLYVKGQLVENLKLNSLSVSNIVQDKSGFYWIQSGNELFQIDFSCRKLIDQSKNIPANLSLGAITLNKDSLFVVGTNDWQQPLLQFNYQTQSFDPVVTLHFPDSIKEYNCIELEQISDSMIIGTSYGCYVHKKGLLYKLDLGEFTNDEIQTITVDGYGALWLSVSKGLIKFEKGETFLFNDLSGIPSKTFGKNGIVVDQDQVLWIGTNNGVAKFNNEVRSINIKKPMLLSRDLNRFIFEDGQTFKLTAGEYYVFNLYSLYLPKYANQFRYQLKKKDDILNKWEVLSSRDQLILKPHKTGQYQLAISSKNFGLSKWSEPLIIQVIIVLPFYKRWYFIGSVILVLVIFIGLVIYRERKRSIMEKAKLEGLVQQRTTELDSSNKELKLLNNTKDRFLSIIAHDLRNPFHTLMGISSLLLRSYDEMKEDERKKLISNIQKTSELSYELLMNLLMWTRVQTGGLEVHPTIFLLNELMVQNIEFAKESAFFKHIEFETSIERLKVFADEDMTSTILRNLLSNAIKFSPHNTVVKVNLRREMGMAKVSIIDQGRGMSADELSIVKMSDSNYSTEGTDNEKGTGFGLSICKEFLKLNDGYLDIESNPGQGSIFTFSLPLADEQSFPENIE